MFDTHELFVLGERLQGGQRVRQDLARLVDAPDVDQQMERKFGESKCRLLIPTDDASLPGLFLSLEEPRCP